MNHKILQFLYYLISFIQVKLRKIRLKFLLIIIIFKLQVKFHQNCMSQYGKPEYWDQRYARDTQPFDWYQRYSGLKDIITTNIDKDHKVLNVGAGNSRLSQEMADQGYSNITNVDICGLVIKAMVQKYKEKADVLKYQQMDIRAMNFGEGQFDAIVDKATFDSILCGQNSTINAGKTISQIYRVLKPNGVYIIVSYGQPQYRLSYLEKPEFEWTVKVQQIPKPTITSTVSIASEDKESPNVHYVYICRKGGS